MKRDEGDDYHNGGRCCENDGDRRHGMDREGTGLH